MLMLAQALIERQQRCCTEVTWPLLVTLDSARDMPFS